MRFQNYVYSILLVCFCFVLESQAQYDDKRCICICPDPSIVNGTSTERKIYKSAVTPNACDCVHVVIPSVGEAVKGKEKEFCLRCECRTESRNTTTIKVVVIFVMWILCLLVVYMGFLLCLDPVLNKRRAMPQYREHTDEEDEAVAAGVSDGEPGMAQPLRVRPNVLGRVSHQQNKWKAQVQEQRKNIYDKHTMLN